MGANIGGTVKSFTSLRPVNQAAAAAFSLKGAGVDLQNHDSFVLHVAAGANTGGGTQAVDCKLQHSDTDVDGNYTDVATSPQNPSVAITQLTAVNTDRRVEIDRRGLKRFVRPVFTVALAGGATGIGLMATIVAGDAVVAPVSQ